MKSESVRKRRPLVPKRVLCFTTGGTIASARDYATGSVGPSIRGSDLLRNFSISGDTDIEVVELGNVPSGAIDVSTAFAWALYVRNRLTDPTVLGAVVTIGTNVMEECAYLFDLLISGNKPVVFTGAMRMPSHPEADGPYNLASGIYVAQEPNAHGLGVVVVINGVVHAARDVRKGMSSGPDAFESPVTGPIGELTESGAGPALSIFRRPIREYLPTRRIEARVGYVKSVLGLDGAVIEALIQQGARGIVLEGFADGGTTVCLGLAIERVLSAAAVEVVLTTRPPRTQLDPTYTLTGEVQWMIRRGVRTAEGLFGEKARIKLMLALGSGNSRVLDAAFPRSKA